MTTYFTSDLHFYHKNVCKFTRRHEVVQQEHHEEWLIDIWNSTVKKSDKIWHLGDLTFLTKYEDIAVLVKKLNGQKFFIKGNHDRTKVLDQLKKDNLIQNWYQYEEIKIGETPVCLFHFPIASWHKVGHGAWHLHGHSHSSYKTGKGKILDVGIDSAYDITGKHKFFSEEDIANYMSHREVQTVDHHRIIEKE